MVEKLVDELLNCSPTWTGRQRENSSVRDILLDSLVSV